MNENSKKDEKRQNSDDYRNDESKGSMGDKKLGKTNEEQTKSKCKQKTSKNDESQSKQSNRNKEPRFVSNQFIPHGHQIFTQQNPFGRRNEQALPNALEDGIPAACGIGEPAIPLSACVANFHNSCFSSFNNFEDDFSLKGARPKVLSHHIDKQQLSKKKKRGSSSFHSLRFFPNDNDIFNKDKRNLIKDCDFTKSNSFPISFRRSAGKLKNYSYDRNEASYSAEGVLESNLGLDVSTSNRGSNHTQEKDLLIDEGAICDLDKTFQTQEIGGNAVDLEWQNNESKCPVPVVNHVLKKKSSSSFNDLCSDSEQSSFNLFVENDREILEKLCGEETDKSNDEDEIDDTGDFIDTDLPSHSKHILSSSDETDNFSSTELSDQDDQPQNGSDSKNSDVNCNVLENTFPKVVNGCAKEMYFSIHGSGKQSFIEPVSCCGQSQLSELSKLNSYRSLTSEPHSLGHNVPRLISCGEGAAASQQTLNTESEKQFISQLSCQAGADCAQPVASIECVESCNPRSSIQSHGPPEVDCRNGSCDQTGQVASCGHNMGFQRSPGTCLSIAAGGAGCITTDSKNCSEKDSCLFQRFANDFSIPSEQTRKSSKRVDGVVVVKESDLLQDGQAMIGSTGSSYDEPYFVDVKRESKSDLLRDLKRSLDLCYGAVTNTNGEINNTRMYGKSDGNCGECMFFPVKSNNPPWDIPAEVQNSDYCELEFPQAVNISSTDGSNTENITQKSEEQDLLLDFYRSAPDVNSGEQSKDTCCMIWNQYEAYSGQVKQIGVSACGPTAVLNVLKALKVNCDKSKVLSVIPTSLRKEDAHVPEYLFSRACAGTTATELIDGVSSLTGGAIGARFFHFWPPRQINLLQWLADWMNRGAVPVATLNLQLGSQPVEQVPDAWHHQMVYGVSSHGIFLTNPLEVVSEQVAMRQLCSDSELLVRRQDIVDRFRHDSDLRLLACHKDPRWRTMNVIGQVINVLREENSPSIPGQRLQMTSHIKIPASYQAGITLFMKKSKASWPSLINSPDLPLLGMIRETNI